MVTRATNPTPAKPAAPAAAPAVTTNPVTQPLTRAQVLADIRASEARIMQAMRAMEQRMGVTLGTIRGAVAPNAAISTPATVRAVFTRPGQRVPKQITGPGIVKPATSAPTAAAPAAAPMPATGIAPAISAAVPEAKS